MAYEIPKNLKYEEKIVFNLSIWQALWVALFGILVWTVFVKTGFSFEVKVLASIFLGILGLGFAFFDLKKNLTIAANFLLKPRQLGYFDKNLDRFLQVEKIENDTVFLKNGGSKTIVQVVPINFHILSGRQQEAIISAFKDFLNSLDFPIQIVMRTVNLSIDEYLEQLEVTVKKHKKPLLEKQFTDFKKFVQEYIEENAVKNRLFYVVVPNEKKAPPKPVGHPGKALPGKTQKLQPRHKKAKHTRIDLAPGKLL